MPLTTEQDEHRLASALLILLDGAAESDPQRLRILGSIVERVLTEYEGKVDKEVAAEEWIAHLAKRVLHAADD